MSAPFTSLASELGPLGFNTPFLIIVFLFFFVFLSEPTPAEYGLSQSCLESQLEWCGGSTEIGALKAVFLYLHVAIKALQFSRLTITISFQYGK